LLKASYGTVAPGAKHWTESVHPEVLLPTMVSLRMSPSASGLVKVLVDVVRDGEGAAFAISEPLAVKDGAVRLESPDNTPGGGLPVALQAWLLLLQPAGVPVPATVVFDDRLDWLCRAARRRASAARSAASAAA
jgi:hypothetical protein